MNEREGVWYIDTDESERFEPSCTLSEIFQPMVPWVSFMSGIAIGGALVMIYLTGR